LKRNVESTARSRNDLAFVGLLGALSMLAPLGIDVSLPGLPTIARALHASGGSLQATLSVFVFAFGAGQLVLGPLSDRYGRRPVLLAGLALFALAGAVCTFATDVRVLLAARFVQGLGACAGSVIARAIVQDVATDRARAASLQSYISAVSSLAPILAPLIGSAVLVLWGWRALYGVVLAAGLALIVAVTFGLRETAPRASRRIGEAYARVLRLPRTIPLAALVACQFGAYFALISGSPFALVEQMHVPSGLYALAFALNACALLAGSFGGGRVAHRVGPERLFAFGVALSLVAGIAVCALDALVPTPVVFVAGFAFVAFAFGIAFPGAFAAGLAEAKGDAGVASGILGASQMLGGAIGSAATGLLPFAPSAAVGTVVLVGTAGCAVAYLASRK
jgi:DHA1 family bicyclomycin/chloramphenicol resistance-like MFS transporter